MLQIPLTTTPSQTLSVMLGGQNCQLAIRQKSTGVFLDVSVAGRPVVLSALCLDRVRLVRRQHLGFAGDLAFVDTQGRTDPQYTGLGTRYQLVYVEAEDL
jgi:hypothetical protein